MRYKHRLLIAFCDVLTATIFGIVLGLLLAKWISS